MNTEQTSKNIFMYCHYFFMIKKQNPRKKNEIKISNLVKQKLQHMDVYDAATAEQQIEPLTKT